MRFAIVYYLLLLYVSVICRPIIPVVIDVLSHTFADANHILKIHAKYGNNHLEKEIADSNSDDNNPKDQNTVKSEEITQVHISAKKYTYTFSPGNIDRIFSCAIINNLPVVFLSKHIPPPKS